MTQYYYPQNLKAKANIWLWGMRDFIILGVGVLLSVVALVKLGWIVPAAITLCFGFMTIRSGDMTVLEYIRYAARYFITEQQYYKWR